jgi:hypothetical protein
MIAIGTSTNQRQRRRRRQHFTLLFHSLLPFFGIWILQQQQQPFHGFVYNNNIWENDPIQRHRNLDAHPNDQYMLTVLTASSSSLSWFNSNHAKMLSSRRRSSTTTTITCHNNIQQPFTKNTPLSLAFIHNHRGGGGGSTYRSRMVGTTTTASNDDDDEMPALPIYSTETDPTTTSLSSLSVSERHRRKVMIIMDGFCSYHSGYFQQRIQEIFPNVILLHVVSDYLYGYIQQQQQDDNKTTNGDDPPQEQQELQQPLPIQRPRTLEEVHALLHKSGIRNQHDTSNISSIRSNNNLPNYDYDFVGVYCESDSGLECAEQLRLLLNVSCCDIPIYSPARRLKHLMQQVVHTNQNNHNNNNTHLPIARQQLCHSIEEVQEFAQILFNDSTNHTTSTNNNNNNNNNHHHHHRPSAAAIVIKPIRGVASESVALCHTMEEVILVWNTITSSQIFGGTITTTNTTTNNTTSTSSSSSSSSSLLQPPTPQKYHTNVLVQEYLYGTEYAVDVVSRNGEHKVTAVWRYEKHSSLRRYNTATTTATRNTNHHNKSTNAPFCYYRTELIDETMLEQEDLFETICQYVTQSLTALGVRYGVSHNEVIVPFDRPHQPYLIEVNCRQHNMDFLPIVMNCIGYNCLDVTMVAYLGDDPTWDVIPHRPPLLRRYGSMVHLVNSAPAGYLLNNHPILDDMMQLESVYDAEVYEKYCTEGSYLSSPTIDIRSDAGWVQLIHDDAETIEHDYQQIVDWMPIMFQTSPTPPINVDASNTAAAATVDGEK